MKKKIALIQLCSGVDVEKNIIATAALISEAAAAGAKLIVTPENTSLIDKTPGALEKKVKDEANDPALKHFRGQANELGIDLIIGSLPIQSSDKSISNRSYCINSSGEVIAHYNKIHMFDVDLPNGESYRESDRYTPGDSAQLVELGGLKVGLSICYDLRFPSLYRDLALAGAQVLTVPAAFTKQTGEAHWHVLLRARAIETGSYVLAPAQGGHHQDGRDTFGHSLVVSPWGEILAEGGIEPTVVYATIDTEQVDEARFRIPNLKNGRRYRAPLSVSS